jgi:hypothetical protein
MAIVSALEVTISGSYRNFKKEIIDYEGVVGVIPLVSDEKALQHVKRRYAPRWISEDARYTDRLHSERSTYVDSTRVIEHDFSYIGKDVRDLSLLLFKFTSNQIKMTFKTDSPQF